MSRPAPVHPDAKTSKRTLPDRRPARQRESRDGQELREFMATEPGDSGADRDFKERLRAELKEFVRSRLLRRRDSSERAALVGESHVFEVDECDRFARHVLPHLDHGPLGA